MFAFSSRLLILFQVDQASRGHVSAHHPAGAAVRVHAARHLDSLGRQLPAPLGPDLVLSRPRLALVHHGLDAAAHRPGEKPSDPDEAESFRAGTFSDHFFLESVKKGVRALW